MSKPNQSLLIICITLIISIQACLLVLFYNPSFQLFTDDFNITTTTTTANNTWNPSTRPFYLGFEHVFVIIKDNDSKRTRFMKSQFDFLQINYTFIQGSLPDDASVSEFRLRHPDFKSFSFDHVKISHFRVYERALLEGLNNVLIMEDDVDLEMVAPILVSQFILMVVTNESSPLQDKLTKVNTNVYAMKRNTPLWIGGVAYGLSRQGMEKLMDVGVSNGIAGDVTCLEMIMRGDLNGFVVYPMMADHLGHSSEFPSSRFMVGVNHYPPYQTKLRYSTYEAIRNQLKP
ncbi:hypothetical protein HDV02_004306 [Globomyces sp. JEL0801]|nr:hypothetical protein HDV02_004306 [Globomyces sp. JEL0801]